MLDCLNYESTHTQISYILYFIKISILPTLKGQCGLEGIVIKFLPGINQFKDKLTSNSQYPSMLPSQEEAEDLKSHIIHSICLNVQHIHCML